MGSNFSFLCLIASLSQLFRCARGPAQQVDGQRNYEEFGCHCALGRSLGRRTVPAKSFVSPENREPPFGQHCYVFHLFSVSLDVRGERYYSFVDGLMRTCDFVGAANGHEHSR